MHARNARLGVRLFLVYAVFYGAFVLANACTPGVMEATPVAGLNLAVLGGFGLIALAIALALVYGFTAESDGGERSPEGGV